jgi:hypothetical protein
MGEAADGDFDFGFRSKARRFAIAADEANRRKRGGLVPVSTWPVLSPSGGRRGFRDIVFSSGAFSIRR